MAEEFKINVAIGGRMYPLSVKSSKEEEGMRKAAEKINSLITVFEKNYAVSDKQDVLAMCALQFASKIEINSILNSEQVQQAENKLIELNKTLDAYLN